MRVCLHDRDDCDPTLPSLYHAMEVSNPYSFARPPHALPLHCCFPFRFTPSAIDSSRRPRPPLPCSALLCPVLSANPLVPFPFSPTYIITTSSKPTPQAPHGLFPQVHCGLKSLSSRRPCPCKYHACGTSPMLLSVTSPSTQSPSPPCLCQTRHLCSAPQPSRVPRFFCRRRYAG